MFCPICGGQLDVNTSDWYCKKCQCCFEIIQYIYGRAKRLTAEVQEWHPLKEELLEEKKT